MYSYFSRQVVADALVWIEEHLTDPLSVDIVAARTGYSPWHFQRIFKHFTGVTLGKYVRLRRITRAMHELKFTSRKIINIATTYHFECNASFTRIFRQTTGMSPTQYRKNGNVLVKNFMPPLCLDKPVQIEAPVIVEQDPLYFSGIHEQFDCDASFNPEEFLNFNRQAWHTYAQQSGASTGISISYLRRNDSSKYMSIHKHIGTGNTLAPRQNATPFLPAGRYARFKYRGDGSDYFYFLMQAHSYLLNKMDISKRGSHIIERPSGPLQECATPEETTLYLDIPVIHSEGGDEYHRRSAAPGRAPAH